LIEVVLALGIVAIALFPMVAMLPVGIRIQKDTVDETAGINILSAIIADRRASVSGTTSLGYSLPALPQVGASVVSNSFSVTDEGVKTNNTATSRYKIEYRFFPPPIPGAASLLHFRASWSTAAASNGTGCVELITTMSN